MEVGCKLGLINKGKYVLNRIIYLILVLVIVELSSLSNPVLAEQEEPSGKVYLLLIDKLSLTDISAENTPNIDGLLDQSAVGVASSRTLRGRTNLDTSLTIGAGNLARAYGNGIMGYNHDEQVLGQGKTAAEFYQQLTGIDPSGNECLVVNIPEIQANMVQEKVSSIPGSLGEVLGTHGIRVCVLGNGNNGKETLCTGLAIAMNYNGLVPLGDVGEKTYKLAANSFLPYITDYEYLKDRMGFYQDQAQLFVIELSDLARLEKGFFTYEERVIAEKVKRLQDIDNFVGFITSQINPQKDLLLLIAQSPAADQIAQKNYFTPVIAYGKDINHGSLTSPTSRRDYVIANTDIAPSILEFFGLPDDTKTMIGRPFVVNEKPGLDVLKEANDLVNQSSTVNRLRAPVIKGFVISQIAIIVLSLMVIIFFKRLVKLFEFLVVTMAAVPLVLLPLGFLKLSADWMYLLVVITASFLISWVLFILCGKKAYSVFVCLAALMVMGLDIDVITGGNMIKTSILGYDPMAGARYYGIGNEYLGILIGSVIAAAAAFYEKYRGKRVLTIILLVFLVQTAIIGMPTLGANSGGLISCPIAFITTLALLAGIKITWGLIIRIMGAALAVITGLAIYDYHQPPEVQSHIGKAVSQIMNGGINEAVVIISRKLSMNFKLIKTTIWSRVFLVVMMALAILFHQPVGAMKRIMEAYPYLMKGFAGTIIGAFALLVVNDSGIVAASTCTVYLAVPLLLLMLRFRKEKQE
ncbi:MAG: hypothetical protein ACOX0E_08235 [Syntrophomonadaceae bacterium]|jgi:hypothetical protein